jgi:hypothetical protein
MIGWTCTLKGEKHEMHAQFLLTGELIRRQEDYINPFRP